MYMSMVIYVIIWLYEYMCVCDMMCCICGFWACCMTGILYIVLNTMCDYIGCYIMWFSMLYYAVMCVYVDNYVDNFNINVDNSSVYVDNFLLQMQHFYELFEKYCVFVYFHTLSLIISCLLVLSLFFVILSQLAILYIQFNCSQGGMS